jgi:hypothetical protein
MYMLGDQECFFTPDYACRRLRKAGLLRNPKAPIRLRNESLSARSFFALLGVEPYFDIDINEHADYRVDLSQPLPQSLRRGAAAVVDVGTTEHIFNAPQVFRNIVEMLIPNGTVMHLSPISWYNHGFYNFNPLLFNEFYSANGFSKLESRLLISPIRYPLYTVADLLGFRYSPRRVPATPSLTVSDERYFVELVATNLGIWAGAIFLFVARKGPLDEKAVIYPLQGRYSSALAK